MKTVQAYITVGNRKGIHGRVATRIAEIISAYDLDVQLAFNDAVADGSSILDVLSMALVYGSFVRITVTGEQAAKGTALIYTTLISEDHQI